MKNTLNAKNVQNKLNPVLLVADDKKKELVWLWVDIGIELQNAAKKD